MLYFIMLFNFNLFCNLFMILIYFPIISTYSILHIYLHTSYIFPNFHNSMHYIFYLILSLCASFVNRPLKLIYC